MPALFNGTKQLIDIAGDAGAWTPIYATGLLRRFVIRESPITVEGVTNTPTGLTYTLPGVVGTFAIPAASDANEPGTFPKIEVPDPEDTTIHGLTGFYIGNGPDSPGAGVAPSATGSLLCSVRGATATATTIEVVQVY